MRPLLLLLLLLLTALVDPSPIVGTALGQQAPPPPWVQRAFDLKKEADEANRRDLLVLWQDLQSKLKKMSPPEAKACFEKLAERLKNDTRVLKKISNSTSRGPNAGNLAYSTALQKLAGEPGKPGILEEAGDLLSSKDWRQLIDDGPAAPAPQRNHAITVMKTLLVYANVVASGEEDLTKYVSEGLCDKVQFLYPIRTKAAGRMEVDLKGVALASKTADKNEPFILQLPNSGFVGAGQLTDGRFRGLETAGFIKECLNSTTQYNSEFLEAVYLEIKGTRTPALLEARRKYGEFLASHARNFAIVPNPSQLQPGDLVSWRGKLGGGTVMVVEAIPGGKEFLGIGDTRSRPLDIDLEGINVYRWPFVRKDLTTTALRPKRSGK